MEILFLIIIGIIYFAITSVNKEPVRDIQKEVILEPPKEDPQLKKLLQEYKGFFDNLLGYPLTDEQRRAIVDDSERSLVIASAGSGKTSTILGKYAYLIKSGLASKEEILVLAFNRPVVEEIKLKIQDLVNIDAEVETFHSIGNAILKEAGKPTTLSKLSEEDKEGILTTQNVEMLITMARKEMPDIDFSILEFRALCPHHDIEEFVDNEEEYNQAINSFPYKRDEFRVGEADRHLKLPTIDGKTWVRSQQELLIANSLIMNGINFEYERRYPNSLDSEYHPDFYYPDLDLWHEHFAINRKGESPFKGYKEEMQWKKEFHKSENNTILYTYSYEYEEDKILDKIYNHLEQLGLSKKPIDKSIIEENLKKYYSDDTYQFIRNSIKLSKTNNLSPEQVEDKYLNLQNQFRANKFKKFFIPIYRCYQQYLEENKEIDFEDMLNLGRKSLKETTLNNKYKYILVDEFQDLSFCRGELLTELLGQNARLFGVGDDWQSIYRFTGSDISLTTEFESRQTEPVKLENKIEENELVFPEIKTSFRRRTHVIRENFRSVSDITDLSSKFIQRNPYQLKKEIKSKKRFIGNTNPEYKGQGKLNPINVCAVDDYTNQSIEKILDLIPRSILLKSNDSSGQENKKEKKEVMILARENKDLDEITPKLLMKKRDDLEITLASIHKSKGLECDVSIVLGLDGGIRGFPKLSGEDPLISIFLATGELYRSSEERRVLYVAMTRSKDNVFLLNSRTVRSSFLDEVVDIAQESNLHYKSLNLRKHKIKPCPECRKKGKSGSLFIKTNKKKYSLFLGCEFYRWNTTIQEDPLFCDYTEDKVPCVDCRSKGLDGLLSTERRITDKGPRRIAVCDSCNFERSFFEF